MTNTANLSLPLLSPEQFNKFESHNIGITILDVMHMGVTTIANEPPAGVDLTTLPAFIVGTGTGAWAGQDNKLAYYNVATWEFITPVDQMTIKTRGNPNQVFKYTTANGWETVTLGGSTSNVTSGGSTSNVTLVMMTQAEFDAITPVANTLYLINE